MIGRTLARLAVGGAVFLVAVSLGVVLRGNQSNVIGLDPLMGRPAPTQTAVSPTPSPTPSGGTRGCDPRADPRLRATSTEVATAVRYAVGTAPATTIDPPAAGPIPFAVAYPVVTAGTGGVGAAAARRINADVRGQVLAAMSPIADRPPRDRGTPPSPTSQPTFDSAPDGLLGVRIDLGLPGTRHGGALISTYDLGTGARVRLQDLFAGGAACERPLCQAIADAVVDSWGGELLDPDEPLSVGRQPGCPYLGQAAGGFDAPFLVEPDGLAVVFEPCRLVACAGGVTVVTVPFGRI